MKGSSLLYVTRLPDLVAIGNHMTSRAMCPKRYVT